MRHSHVLQLLMAAFATAAPEVVVEELPNQCQTFPGAHQVGQHGCEAQFQLYADSTGNPAVDGKHATLAPVAADLPAWGRVAIVSDQLIAWPQFRYSDWRQPGDIQGLSVNAQDPATGAFRYTPIKLQADDDNRQLLFAYTVAGYPLAPFAHHDGATGARLPGVFLGLRGQTTWAFSLDKNPRGEDQYALRLVTNDTAPLRRGEFEGFLRAGEQFENVD